MAKITLTEKQAQTLDAFCEAFELCTTGQWPAIAENMREQGVADPDDALEDAREKLRN